ncbi:MAG: hypothetical protein ACRD2O_03835 [Terriglobia bacterium]
MVNRNAIDRDQKVSTFLEGAGDVDHLSGFHSCGGFEQGCENRLIRAYFIARHVGDDDGYFERIGADELLEFAINGNENV